MKTKILSFETRLPLAKQSLMAILSAAVLAGCSSPVEQNGVVRIALSPEILADLPQEDSAISDTQTMEKPSTNTVETIDTETTITTEQITPQQEDQDHVAAITIPQQTLTQLLPNQKLKQIIQSALAFNNQNSPLPLTVQQRQAESEAIRKSSWPTIQPSVRWERNGKPYAGVEAAYTLVDFGVSNQREKRGDLAVEISQLDFNLEQRNIAADVLIDLAKLFALKEKSRLTQEALKGLNELARYANFRVQAGFINASEPLLLNLRIAELNSEKNAMEAEIILKTKLLSAKLLYPIDLADVPSFSEMKSGLLPIAHTGAIQLRRADINKQIAHTKLKQSERELFPQLAVEGGVGIGLSHGSSKQHNVGLVLRSPTSLFTGGAQVRAAEAEYLAASQEAKQIQLKLDTELERIQLERTRLNQNRETLLQLTREGEHALSLFKAQFEAATATISDGLNAHRTLLQTRQQLMDLEAELLVLDASEIRISEGPFLAE